MSLLNSKINSVEAEITDVVNQLTTLQTSIPSTVQSLVSNLPSIHTMQYDSTGKLGPWIYVGDYNAVSQNGGIIGDMLLQFVAHTTTTADPGVDCIVFLRFKAASLSGSVFYGNGQAYYIGQTVTPSSFVISQGSGANSAIYSVYAFSTNYGQGSSVIIDSVNFTYFGTPVLTKNVPTGSTARTITPIAIYTADNPPTTLTTNLSIVPTTSNSAPTNTDAISGLTFYRRADRQIVQPYDAWTVGRGFPLVSGLINLGLSPTTTFSIQNANKAGLFIDSNTGVYITGLLSVFNGLTLQGPLTVYDPSNATNIISNATITGNLHTTGNATIDGGLTVAGKVIVTNPGSLKVTSTAVLASTAQYAKLMSLTLPSGGNHARIQVNMCNGFQISASTPPKVADTSTLIQNYTLDMHLYSSGGTSSRAFDTNSNTTGNSSSCYHNGYVVATSVLYKPLGVYLVPNPLDATNSVDVWIGTYGYWGKPLITVAQSAGTYIQSTTTAASLPNYGWVKLNVYTTTLTYLATPSGLGGANQAGTYV
jgi:hypothetical protein